MENDKDYTKFCIRATGVTALFTSPETKLPGERRSSWYPYYEQLKNMIQAIFWKPEICIVVDRCRIMNKARFQTGGVLETDFGGAGHLDGHQPVAQTMLCDVEYIIEFHIVENMSDYAQKRIAERVKNGGEPWSRKKYEDIMERAITKGAHRIPYFGTSDCPAIIRPCDDFFAGEGYYDHTSCDIGLVYHGMNYPEQAGDGIKAAADDTVERRFAHLKMENGVIEYPTPEKCEFIQVIDLGKKRS